MTIWAVVLSLLVGWKWNPGVGFGVIATLATPLVILVYMLVSVGSMRYYLRQRRSEFNPLLHLVLPIGGIVLFFFPLYYQFYKQPPGYPFKYANWIALGWVAAGVLLTAYVTLRAPERLADMDRVYVEDESLSPPDAAAAFPVA
jgi:amino acid transporter